MKRLSFFEVVMADLFKQATKDIEDEEDRKAWAYMEENGWKTDAEGS